VQIMVYSDALNLLFIFRKVLSICNINNCPKWLKTICLKGKFQEYVDFEVSQRLGRLVLPHQLAYTFCSLGHVQNDVKDVKLWQTTEPFHLFSYPQILVKYSLYNSIGLHSIAWSSSFYSTIKEEM